MINFRSLAHGYLEGGRERERECVCVCVRERERERERERSLRPTWGFLLYCENGCKNPTKTEENGSTYQSGPTQRNCKEGKLYYFFLIEQKKQMEFLFGS